MAEVWFGLVWCDLWLRCTRKSKKKGLFRFLLSWYKTNLASESLTHCGADGDFNYSAIDIFTMTMTMTTAALISKDKPVSKAALDEVGLNLAHLGGWPLKVPEKDHHHQ